MPELPIVSGREARGIFERLGWEFRRQNGSHMILTKSGSLASLSVPDYREVARGTLRSLLRSADVELSEFIKAAE